MTRQVDHRPDTRLGLALGLVVAACTAGPVAWALGMRERLPAEVARHWGFDGRATATWSLTTQLWAISALILLLAGGLGAIAVVGRQPLVLRRCLAGCAAWLATFLAALQVDGLRTHLDVADPMAAAAPSAGIAAGALAGIAVAVVVAAQARESPHGRRAAGRPDPSLPRLDGPPSLPWRRTTPLSRWIVGFLVASVAALAAPALAGLWGFLVIAALVGGLVLATARWTVEIDGEGLVARNGVVTLLRLPIDEVAAAWEIRDLNPFWEFGGWGLRVDVQGRTGIVGRRGPALAIRRGDGSEIVISLDAAAEAAATLNTLADRRHDGAA